MKTKTSAHHRLAEMVHRVHHCPVVNSNVIACKDSQAVRAIKTLRSARKSLARTRAGASTLTDPMRKYIGLLIKLIVRLRRIWSREKM